MCIISRSTGDVFWKRTRFLVAVMCLGAGALAGDQEPGWRYGIGAGTRITLLPATDLYPSYMAAPREPRFALKIMSMTRRGIEQTPRSRLGTWVGGSVGLFRVHPAGQSGRGFQLQLGAGGFATRSY